MRAIARMSASGLAETRSMGPWLRNAMGRLDDPRRSRSNGTSASETTWNLVSRDGSFSGYAQLSVTPEGDVRILIRDRSSKPLKDDYVFVEPPRRDESTKIRESSSHTELRAAVDRWIDYIDALDQFGTELIEKRKCDVGRAGLLKTRSISTGLHTAIVDPPTAHHRMLVNGEASTCEEDRSIEDAIDARWNDVVEIGMTVTSACRTWRVMKPDSFFVMGDPDPMEMLRLHKGLLEGPGYKA